MKSTELLALSNRELEAEITELAGHLNAATYRWLVLLAEFDRRQGWAGAQIASCAHWLNFKVGLNLGAAREKVRVAHAIGTLPKIAASMSCGRLSYSKVRALTRFACPETEDMLLMYALHGTAFHVERLARHYRRARHLEDLQRETQQEVGTSFSYWFDHDGSLVFKGRMPAVKGALFIKAMEAAMEAAPDHQVERRNFAQRRADAIGEMAETYLQHGIATTDAADRYQVVVHVDTATLQRREDGRCQLEQGPAVSVETARRLTCDSSIVTMTEDERGEPLDVGRKTRVIPPAVRRALKSRDEGCRFPGCTYHRYLDAHHVKHWADGGETKLSNLMTLCRWHHRLVHTGDIVIQPRKDGGWAFFDATGRPYHDAASDVHALHGWRVLINANLRRNLDIYLDSAVTRWAGERMDYDHALHCLFERERRPDTDVSAETSP